MTSNLTFSKSISDLASITQSYKCTKISENTLFFPLTNESEWSNGIRVLFYFMALLWCFMGVAIAADLFMCAIEIITSKTKKIRVATGEDDNTVSSEYEEVEIRVWNGTVANLTLMALGTSAPEILLSIIEIVGSNFKAGELGPGTIVGSAAFNLFVITAVCVMAIGNGEVKRISSLGVFFTTSFFAIFAYIWLFIILSVTSPNEVEVWEAALTFLFFPVLVISAYIADKDLCSNMLLSKSRKQEVELGNLDLLNERILKKHHPDLIEYMKEITANSRITEDEAAKLIAMKIDANKNKNYGYYRVASLRNIGGGRKPLPKLNEKLQLILVSPKENCSELGQGKLSSATPANEKAYIEFTASAVSVMENCKSVQLGVERSGNIELQVQVGYETIDGTAEAGSDYISKKDVLIFQSNETHKHFEVTIIDDNEWEPDETFFVKLYPTQGTEENVIIGHHSITEVTIINDDDPGTVSFEKPSYIVKESCGKAELAVDRINGADGKLEVLWKTKDQSALHGKDFIGGQGSLIFEHGETCKAINIEIIDDHMFEKDETFVVEFTEIKPAGAKFGRLKRTVVTIVSDDEYKNMFNRVVNLAHVNLDKFELGAESWGQQFREAMNVNGGDVDSASVIDYIMHFITFFWKVLFAFVPPCKWYGGWLAFFIVLILIGILTAIIGDLATLFGCLVGLQKEVTAITFVAMGTSLPDLFASRTAAQVEKFADASVVNITGSNGVNVFLGLGIPWLMAAIFHSIKKTPGGFVTPAGTLATSVVTYTVCSLVCIVLLILRRYLKVFGRGELGGNKTLKYFSGIFMISLWLLYVLVSSLVAYKHISPISF
ncbi:sodium/calcium exchanger 3 isoform X2 [Hydra vulgaris]|uniref:Sodium/calcium exchanger 3 isoform X2 n=1 Tax=Hydra vulgaris TaxID=6087 RepID=A0ABM4CF58_HYDVU